MSARDDVLARIKWALRDAPAVPEVPRNYRRSTDMTAQQRLEQLVDRLEDYKANVITVPEAQAADALAQLLAGTATVVVPHGLDPAWLVGLPAASGGTGSGRAGTDDVGTGGTQGPAVVVDSPEHRLTVAELDAVDAVVTGAAVAVSETGTIILDGSPSQGPRVISLVPDRHVCVLRSADIVEVLPEAVARLEPTAPQTWISGPSATSDIELERVEGVHGPRTLDVLILQ